MNQKRLLTSMLFLGLMLLTSKPATAQWTQSASSGPSSRQSYALAHDTVRNRTVLYGGFSPARSDTWEWNGTAWNQVPVSGPGPRQQMSMAFDAARGKCVLFGGYNGASLQSDTWIWDGLSWTLAATAGPGQRYDYAMAYDPIRARVVLFGGAASLNAPSDPRNDTWEWNGLSWTQVASTGPSPRHSASMTYDAARNRIVLFGGQDVSASWLGDTWEWNGISWTQVASGGPPARRNHGMAFHPGRGRTVLFGGRTTATALLGDTWEWNGAAWTQVTSAPAPSARSSFSMTYAGAASGVLLFGGFSAPADTWSFGINSVGLSSVDRAEHPTGGGTPIVIFGSGLSPGLGFRINGQPLTDVRWMLPTKMTGRVPANPAGQYALEAVDGGSGTVLATLPGSVRYAAIGPASPNDIEVYHLHNEVRIRWSNPDAYSSIQLFRNGSPLATLAGTDTEFTDDLQGALPGTVTYDLVGIDTSGAPSRPTPFIASDFTFMPRCSPVYMPNCGLATMGRDNQPPQRMINVYGLGFNEVQTGFTLDGNVTNGLSIEVWGRRVRIDGDLRARIRAAATGAIVADGIVIADWAVSAVTNWRNGAVAGAFPAGDYVLGFYTEGGDPDAIHFALLECSAAGDLGEPFPCPPYPIAMVRAFECGNIPPQINGIDAQRVLRTPEDPHERAIFVTAQAFGPSNQVVSYRYDFDDGRCCLTSASPLATHTFASYGTYEVTVTATDLHGMSSTASISLPVKAPVVVPLLGSGPLITHSWPAPQGRAYIPNIASPDVNEAFVARITPAPGALINASTVFFRLRHPTTDAVIFTQAGVKADPTDPDPDTDWRAIFNMSALPELNSVVLEISASDDQGLPAVPVRVSFDLCPLPQSFRQPFVQTVIHCSKERTYTIEGSITPATVGNSLQAGSNTLNFIGALSHQVDFRVTAKVSMHNKHYFDGSLYGEVRPQILSSPLFSETWTANPSNSTFLDCPDFGLAFRWCNRKIFEKTWTKKLLDNRTVVQGACITPMVPVVCFDATVSLQIEAFLRVFADFFLTLRDHVPYVEAEICVRPSGGLGSGTSGSVAVNARLFGLKWAKIASATGYLFPQFTAEFPTLIEILPTPQITPSACFRFDLDYQVRVKIAVVGTVYDSGRRDISSLNEIRWPSGCSSSSPCPPCVTLEHGPTGPPPPEVPEPRLPALAASPNGQRSLLVYVLDTDEDPWIENTSLYYSVRNGSGAWSPPAPIYAPDDFGDDQPQVVFINDTEAILTWTRNRLPYAQVRGLATTTSGLNQALRSVEVYAASWRAGIGWGSAQTIDNDSSADSFPKLARIPGANAAMCVFQKSSGDVLNANGSFRNKCEVWAARIGAGGAPDEPERLDLPGGTRTDFAPTIAFAPNQPIGYAAWIRDVLPVGGSPKVFYARYENQNWSSSHLGIDNPPIGTDDLSLAMRDSEVGALACGAGESLLGFADGIYVSRFDTAGGNNPFGAMDRIGPARCISDGVNTPELPDFQAAKPQIMHLGGDRYAVGCRAFVHDGRADADGEVAIATIDYGNAAPSWAIRTVTNDNATELETVFERLGNNAIQTIRTTSAAGPELDGLVAADIDLRPDLAVDRIALSDRHAAPGRPIEVRVTLRNAGLRAVSPGMGATTALLGFVLNGSVTPLASAALDFVAAPDAEQTVEFTVLAPFDVNSLRVEVDALPEETVIENNQSDVAIGVPAPTDLSCSVAIVSGSRQIRLTWVNADGYDTLRIYRDGTQRAEIAGDASAYIDLDAPSGSHTYSVRGAIGLTLSPTNAAVCGSVSGDLNGDCIVSLADLTILLSHFGFAGGLGDGDIDGNGSIDLTDLAILLSFFGSSC